VIEDDTSISEDMINDEQLQISLTNYPNPFKISTTISFSCRIDTENTEINIYNIKGQRIKQYSIFNNQSSITWDGKDEGGKFVSSGIYFARLFDGKQVVTRKMILKK